MIEKIDGMIIIAIIEEITYGRGYRIKKAWRYGSIDVTNRKIIHIIFEYYNVKIREIFEEVFG